jgi:hypothetical protein
VARESRALRAALVETVFGGFPDGPSAAPRVEADGDGRTRRIHFRPSPAWT